MEGNAPVQLARRSTPPKPGTEVPLLAFAPRVGLQLGLRPVLLFFSGGLRLRAEASVDGRSRLRVLGFHLLADHPHLGKVTITRTEPDSAPTSLVDTGGAEAPGVSALFLHCAVDIERSPGSGRPLHLRTSTPLQLVGRARTFPPVSEPFRSQRTVELHQPGESTPIGLLEPFRVNLGGC
ncbi:MULTISPECIES: hypothetical protein [unclassified Crossiella]|uniref:hypothetical protein n=1 Tax=unclassified Crossiella TaxID=2620835 RepID=UPI00200018E3|nr:MULTISPECIES: hypothetical protein [unclassified Crossiella]MCK2245104.1 hypothetical protein [Crossiella sp. S99.2]MCK2258685.1 hypothetical protein [Crossiella sp. S99.1]